MQKIFTKIIVSILLINMIIGSFDVFCKNCLKLTVYSHNTLDNYDFDCHKKPLKSHKNENITTITYEKLQLSNINDTDKKLVFNENCLSAFFKDSEYFRFVETINIGSIIVTKLLIDFVCYYSFKYLDFNLVHSLYLKIHKDFIKSLFLPIFSSFGILISIQTFLL